MAGKYTSQRKKLIKETKKVTKQERKKKEKLNTALEGTGVENTDLENTEDEVKLPPSPFSS